MNGSPPVDHRPWPLPQGPWIMAQRWHDLLFAHWPVPAASLRPLIPASLELDTKDGQAWLGVVPFRMSGVRLRGTPPVPGLSAFPELNVRTYVTAGGKAGVWFFSLDAANRLAVGAARRWFHLPYHFARMSLTERAGEISYESTRADGSGARFSGVYRPTGEPFQARPGSIDYWLTERYCLYAATGGRILRAEIDHAPWPLQRATATIATNSMTSPLSISLPAVPPLLHFARRQDVRVWAPRPIA